MIWLKLSQHFFSFNWFETNENFGKSRISFTSGALNSFSVQRKLSKYNRVQRRSGGGGSRGDSRLGRARLTPAPSCAWLKRSRSRRRCLVGKRRERRGRPSRNATSRRTSSRWTAASRRRCRSARTRRWSRQDSNIWHLSNLFTVESFYKPSPRLCSSWKWKWELESLSSNLIALNTFCELLRNDLAFSPN